MRLESAVRLRFSRLSAVRPYRVNGFELTDFRRFKSGQGLSVYL